MREQQQTQSSSDLVEHIIMSMERMTMGLNNNCSRQAPKEGTKHRTTFTPEGIQAARDACANHGNSAASGSAAGPIHAPGPGTNPSPVTDRMYHCQVNLLDS
ncbi:hypothetical protein ABBQ38_007962 [Trebouxia sp. C0009 RCD-2024]